MTTDAGENARTSGSLATEVADAWLGDALQRAQARADTLARELEQVRAALQAQQDEVSRLHDRLALLDGRTLRHEAGQDLVRELSQRLAALGEQLDAETTTRRALVSQLERATQRDHEAEEVADRALEQFARRVDQFEGRQAAGEERQRDIASGLAERAQDEQTFDGRLSALERQVAADRAAARHAGEELSRLAGLAPGVAATVDDLRALVHSLQVDQRRLDDDVAAQRAIRDREADLLDVLEQQRATRARTEERLNAVEEQLEELRRAVAASADDRTLLSRGQAGLEQRIRVLGEALEQQRQTLIAHLRRQLHADELAGRRRIEEIERSARAARDLLVRLSEESDEPGGAPPR